MDENKEIEKAIYHHDGEGDFWFLGKWIKPVFGFLLSLGNGILAGIVLIGILSFFVEIQIWVLYVVWVPISLCIFYLILKGDRESKASYKIYDDRIEFFNEKYPLEKDIIDLKEIDQVQYEDDFGKAIVLVFPINHLFIVISKMDISQEVLE